jgi:hypothetical protein
VSFNTLCSSCKRNASPGGRDINRILAGNLRAKFDGLYNHIGDTRGNEWYTEISGMAIAPSGPSGSIPATIPPQFLQFPVI